MSAVQFSAEVAAALAAGRPVVALESSIVAQGLPSPHNLRAALGCEEAVRAEGAVPATIAVLDGVVKAGLSVAELERLAEGGAVKAGARDLGWVIAARGSGATTVAGTLRVAALAGIRFLATGGVGGVHRGVPDDVSADLGELARSQVAVFCAGVKLVLDIPLTLERLESLSVPVLGYRCKEFPAFYLRRSGHPVSARLDDPAQVAAVLRAAWEMETRGVLVAVPPPRELEDAEELVARAVATLPHLRGAQVTPRLLERVAELSEGRSLDVNVELVVNNSTTAARCAVAYHAS